MTSPRAEGCSTSSDSDRESAIADRRTRRGGDDQCRSRRRTQPSPWLDLRHLVKVISKVLWCKAILTAVGPTPKPPAETWFVPGFSTRAAAASRGRISWICRSDVPQRSRQTEVCLADMQESRPASHYHSPAVKWPVTRWATARRVDWLIDWCCVFVAEQQNSS